MRQRHAKPTAAHERIPRAHPASMDFVTTVKRHCRGHHSKNYMITNAYLITRKLSLPSLSVTHVV